MKYRLHLIRSARAVSAVGADKGSIKGENSSEQIIYK